jgi:hypothetical protein
MYPQMNLLKRGISRIIQILNRIFPDHWKNSKLSFFSERPTRQFLFPDSNQFGKIYFILTSMHFEVLQQNKDSTQLYFEATRQPSNKDIRRHLRAFKNITVTLRGVFTPSQGWQVRVVLETPRLSSQTQVDLAELILEDLMNALGWKTYGVAEFSSPSNTTLAA